MLRVAYSYNAGRERWTLCGRLAGPWVDELRSFWRKMRERTPRANALVDLTDVTFVDDAGESLLADLAIVGAEFVASGVANKHLIACLKHKQEETALHGRD